MALVTAQQFPGLTPDVLGSVQKGLASRQLTQQEANQERLRGLAETQRGTRQRALGVPSEVPADETQAQAQQRTIADDPVKAGEMLKTLGIVDTRQKEEAAAFATKVLQAPPELKKSLIQERIRTVSARGGDPSESILLLDMDPGKLDASMRGLEAAALTSLQRAELPAKQEMIDIRRQGLILRQSEADLRKLDQQLKRETNTLKREELQLKLNEKKIEVDQAKRDREFTSQSSLGEMDNSIGTIERMLEGKKLESAAGVEANFPTLAGSEAADFEGMLETLQSQTFLTQVEKMKGLGALSENEGKKLGAAIGSLDIKMKDETLRREINRILGTMRKAKERLQKKFDVKPVALPDGVTEEDITETMRANNMTRQQVLDRLGVK